jgi:hypothetical protein
MRRVGTGVLMSVREGTGRNGEPVYVGRIKRKGGGEFSVRVDEAGNPI